MNREPQYMNPYNSLSSCNVYKFLQKIDRLFGKQFPGDIKKRQIFSGDSKYNLNQRLQMLYAEPYRHSAETIIIIIES